MTTTRILGPANRSAEERAWTFGPLLALLAACSGCATWTTHAVPAEPVLWAPPSGPPPELVLDGTYDDATGEVVVSLSAVLPAGSPAPRVERCARSSASGAGAIVAGIAGVGLLGLGAGLTADGAGREPATGWFAGLNNLGTGLEIGGGAIAIVSGIVTGVIAISLIPSDEDDETECSIDEPLADAPATTAPTTVAVDQFLVRVVRRDGTSVVHSGSGGGLRIPLEPAPFACPGACLATVARRMGANVLSENDLRREQVLIEAVPQGEMFGTDAAPIVSGIIDVFLMP